MVNKKMLTLTGVLVLSATAVLLLDRRDKQATDPRLGRSLLDPAQAVSVDHIDLRKPAAGQGALVLVKGGDQIWRVAAAAAATAAPASSPAGFPADPVRILRLLDDLSRIKLTALVARKKDELAALGLEAGPVLTLGAQGKDLLSLSLGELRKGGGQYVALGGEYRAYLAEQAVQVAVDADAWEMKTLLNIDKALVKTLTLTPPPGQAAAPLTLTLTRDKPEAPLAPLPAPDGALPAPQQAEGAATLCSGLVFTRRMAPGNEEVKTALLMPSKALVTLFDGRSYEVAVGGIGEKTRKYFLHITATAPAGLDAKLRADVDELNKTMAANAFEVAPSVGMRFERAAQEYGRTAAGPAAAPKG